MLDETTEGVRGVAFDIPVFPVSAFAVAPSRSARAVAISACVSVASHSSPELGRWRNPAGARRSKRRDCPLLAGIGVTSVATGDLRAVILPDAGEGEGGDVGVLTYISSR